LNPAEIIAKKRDGMILTAGEIGLVVNGIAKGSLPDYQAAAFLMAVTIRGMDDTETALLLDAVLATSGILDFSGMPGAKVDKHSTGGVGDKVSLVLAPLAAACGLIVPMISGRGLGHTGGTLDKLESIPGFRTSLNEQELRSVLEKTGCFISGQTKNLVPADRAMYALRDVTATVPSLPLILASIVSKKIAEGAEALVFDVKTGSGAYMKRTDDARDLAKRLVRLCLGKGLRAKAMITAMDQPLGCAVGNSLEVKESLDILMGRGPGDVKELVLNLGAQMMELAGTPGDEARTALENAIATGRGYEKFIAMVEAQEGDARALEKGLPKARQVLEMESPAGGFVTALDAGLIGRAALLLGAGRRKREDEIDHSAGIVLNKKTGDPVDKGEPVAVLHARSGRKSEGAQSLLRDAIEIGPKSPAPRPLVIETIGGDDGSE